MSNNSAISKFKLSFHYILSYYFKFPVNETGRSEYTISKYIINRDGNGYLVNRVLARTSDYRIPKSVFGYSENFLL